jgi:APA family basic amino acid/polyamine antiporter
MDDARPIKGLPRTLGLWSSVGLVVGITIGSGIFRTPAGIARLLPDPWVMLGVWVLGGLITLCGALSIAGLAGLLPETGGFYAYLREGWGRPIAFLFGWSELVLIRANALGGMSIVFGEYGLRTIGIDPAAHPLAAKALAAAAIAGAALANICGANIGAAIVGWPTAAKFSALALLAGCALALGGAHGASLGHFQSSAGSAVGAGSVGLALVSVLWAYDGFGDVSFAGGEVKDPRRNLPRAIVFGTLAIIGIYVLTNIAYLYVLPVEAIGRSPLVAADVMQALFGRGGVVLVSLFVMISSFSSVNGSMLAAPRVFFAMASDGLFFKALARVHPRFETPHIAILLAALLGMALVMSRSFEALTNTFVLAIWPFYALSVGAIFRLRRRRPDLDAHGVVGYPIVPAVFIAAVVWFVLNALVTDPIPTATTFVLILAGLPVYFVFFASKRAGFR